MKGESKENIEVLAEKQNNLSWIQKRTFEDGTISYDVFIPNLTMVTLGEEDFDDLVEIFKIFIDKEKTNYIG